MESVLTALSADECHERLRSVELGRLGITYKALPVVLPVRIEADGTRLGISSLLGAAIPLPAESVVALEVGTLGEGGAEEWTVEVRGFLRANPTGEQTTDGDRGPGPAGPDFWLSTEVLTGWVRR